MTAVSRLRVTSVANKVRFLVHSSMEVAVDDSVMYQSWREVCSVGWGRAGCSRVGCSRAGVNMGWGGVGAEGGVGWVGFGVGGWRGG